MLIAVKSAVFSSSLPSPTDIEVISVKVGINHDLVLFSIYVPPDSPVSLISSLVLYLSSLVSSYNRLFLLEILISQTSVGHPSLALPYHLTASTKRQSTGKANTICVLLRYTS